jgi:hypothetical protein
MCSAVSRRASAPRRRPRQRECARSARRVNNKVVRSVQAPNAVCAALGPQTRHARSGLSAVMRSLRRPFTRDGRQLSKRVGGVPAVNLMRFWAKRSSTSRFTAAISTATIGLFAGIGRFAFVDGHGSTVVAFKQENCDPCGCAARAGHRLRHGGRNSQEAYRILEGQAIRNGQQILG